MLQLYDDNIVRSVTVFILLVYFALFMLSYIRSLLSMHMFCTRQDILIIIFL
jgi:hypothetical protein